MMGKAEDLTGQRFGMLYVEERAEGSQTYALWRCRCDCGREIVVDSKRLKRGTVVSCGCTPKHEIVPNLRIKDLTGMVFGRLTVLEQADRINGKIAWLCQCSCGNTKIVKGSELKNHKTRSCGCLAMEARKTFRNIAGQQFGYLTALAPLEKRSKNGSVYWRCRCQRCGKEVDYTEDDLVHGAYRSCGCWKKEIQQTICQRRHDVDGTTLELLGERRARSDSSTGVRGVFRRESKYIAMLGFKKRQYFIGQFSELEDAVRARKDAEKLVHAGFVEAYGRWAAKAEKYPDWGKANPLIFEVEKADGRLRVNTNIDLLVPKKAPAGKTLEKRKKPSRPVPAVRASQMGA